MTEVMDDEDAVIFDCPNCGATHEDDSEFFAADTYPRDTGCPQCLTRCGGCSLAVWSDDMIAIGGWSEGSYCTDCVGYCDGCSTYYLNEDLSYDDWDNRYCESCRAGHGDGTIEGYGRTRAVMWLGGPTVKKGGYYLGIELEIATDRMTAVPIKEWAEQPFPQGLGNREAITCKEDSSVEGFEIVTQPMTPEFFEGVNWEGFFSMLNREYPCTTGTDEPSEHGLHVHIGRVAFRDEQGVNDDVMTAAYTYLLSQSTHLDRIARRHPTGYCNKVRKPVSVAVIASQKATKQFERLRANGIYPGRDAINLENESTIEVRAFKSTRKASELRDAVRVVYVAAEYVRSLREQRFGIAKALHWSEFARWTAINAPEAFGNIANLGK